VQIHWFSIANSFMMVVFLVGLVAAILARTLRRDYARCAARGLGPPTCCWGQVLGLPGGACLPCPPPPQSNTPSSPVQHPRRASLPPCLRARSYARDDDADYCGGGGSGGGGPAPRPELSEERGWRLVHGDVFRPPPRLELLAACVGTGMQLALLGLAVIAATIAGALFTERGTILTAWLVCYALTSLVGGACSGRFYAAREGRRWIRAFLLTACLFPGACFAVCALLNTVALGYGSLAAVPFLYILAVVGGWRLVGWGCWVGGLGVCV
jgi:hypothetical protein